MLRSFLSDSVCGDEIYENEESLPMITDISNDIQIKFDEVTEETQVTEDLVQNDETIELIVEQTSDNVTMEMYMEPITVSHNINESNEDAEVIF